MCFDLHTLSSISHSQSTDKTKRCFDAAMRSRLAFCRWLMGVSSINTILCMRIIVRCWVETTCHMQSSLQSFCIRCHNQHHIIYIQFVYHWWQTNNHTVFGLGEITNQVSRPIVEAGMKRAYFFVRYLLPIENASHLSVPDLNWPVLPPVVSQSSSEALQIGSCFCLFSVWRVARFVTQVFIIGWG